MTEGSSDSDNLELSTLVGENEVDSSVEFLLRVGSSDNSELEFLAIEGEIEVDSSIEV